MRALLMGRHATRLLRLPIALRTAERLFRRCTAFVRHVSAQKRHMPERSATAQTRQQIVHVDAFEFHAQRRRFLQHQQLVIVFLIPLNRRPLAGPVRIDFHAHSVRNGVQSLRHDAGENAAEVERFDVLGGVLVLVLHRRRGCGCSNDDKRTRNGKMVSRASFLNVVSLTGLVSGGEFGCLLVYDRLIGREQ